MSLCQCGGRGSGESNFFPPIWFSGHKRFMNHTYCTWRITYMSKYNVSRAEIGEDKHMEVMTRSWPWWKYDIVEEKEHGKCARNATTVHLTLGISSHADFFWMCQYLAVTGTGTVRAVQNKVCGLSGITRNLILKQCVRIHTKSDCAHKSRKTTRGKKQLSDL